VGPSLRMIEEKRLPETIVMNSKKFMESMYCKAVVHLEYKVRGGNFSCKMRCLKEMGS